MDRMKEKTPEMWVVGIPIPVRVVVLESCCVSIPAKSSGEEPRLGNLTMAVRRFPSR